jgi:hypothetical protein
LKHYAPDAIVTVVDRWGMVAFARPGRVRRGRQWWLLVPEDQVAVIA